jgi:hypothetical protein
MVENVNAREILIDHVINYYSKIGLETSELEEWKISTLEELCEEIHQIVWDSNYDCHYILNLIRKIQGTEGWLKVLNMLINTEEHSH